MEAFYQLPFERFERYCPYGTPDDVAEFLAPYAAAGCREFNLIPQAPDHDYAIAGTAAVKTTLDRARPAHRIAPRTRGHRGSGRRHGDYRPPGTPAAGPGTNPPVGRSAHSAG